MRTLSKRLDADDAAKMKSAHKKYVSEFNKLFSAFAKRFTDLFRSYLGRGLTPDEVERVKEGANMLMREEILVPGQETISKAIRRSYLTGQLRSAQFLEGVGIEAQVGISPVDTGVMEILKQRNYTGLKGITDDLGKEITRHITEGVLNNESVSEMTKRLRQSFGEGRNRAETFVRTETMYAYNTAAKAQYQKYGVEMVEWLTADDERTCPRCGPLNGEKFKVGEAPQTPLHPNCRCVLLPVIEGG